MAAVSETIVREYFEWHGFFVRQQRKYAATSRKEDDEIDFLVINPNAVAGVELPFELTSADLKGIARAIVVVKGWHTDSFGPGLLAKAPEVFRFLEPALFQPAVQAFGEEEGAITKLMVIPGLATTDELREQTIELMRGKGVDAVLPFRALLADLINQIEVNRNYQKSDLLQMIRILKNYKLFKDPQLELFKPKRKKRS